MNIPKQWMYLLFSFLFAIPALAQAGNVVVNIPGGVTCSTAKGEPGFDVASWKVGGSATDSVTNGGIHSGAPQFQNLVLNRSLDACSEQIIKDFVGGTRIPALTLIQYDRIGNSGSVYPAITVSLTNSIIESYVVSGASAVRPTEIINITYSKVCISTVAQTEQGSLQQPQKVCYDVATHIVS